MSQGNALGERASHDAARTGADVKGFKETGRSRYITDAEFDQVKAHAHFTVIDAMDLALLSRPCKTPAPRMSAVFFV